MDVARAVALATLGLLACAPAQLRYEERLERVPAPAAHAAHGERLVELMRGLDRLAGERLPRALDLEAAQAGRREEIVEVARAIAASAARIPEAVDELALEASERAAFLAAAATLRERALGLAEHAPELEIDALRVRTAELEATCAGCHERFRIGR